MNPLARFYSLGATDADRRVAAALARAPISPADRYLQDSVVVKAVDRGTRWLHDTWRSSVAGRMLAVFNDRFRGDPAVRRHQAIAVFLLTAAAVHVALTWLQGPRPGWFWTVVPAMAALFAVLVIAGSRSPRSTS